MAESLGKFLQEIFKNEYIATLFVSMFPLIELKGAIPIGTGLFSLPLIKTSLLAYIGSTVISVAVFFLLKPVFNLLKKIPFFKKFVEKVENVFEEKAEKIATKTNGQKEKEARKIMMLSLFIFVAVPFPVTGVWTGTAIAVFLEMKFFDAFLCLSVGNLIAGIIITLLTFLFKAYVDIIIYILFAIAIVMLIVFILKIVLSKPKQSN